jgi:hypothetical protein
MAQRLNGEMAQFELENLKIGMERMLMKGNRFLERHLAIVP